MSVVALIVLAGQGDRGDYVRALWRVPEFTDKPRARKSQSSDPPQVFNQKPMDTTATSWITPPSRPELIENLVSGVGKFANSFFNPRRP
jgi:hypothetical protein